MVGTSRVAEVQLRHSAERGCRNGSVLRRPGGALPVLHRQRLLALYLRFNEMINDRVSPRSRSYTSARRLTFRLLGLATFAIAACAAGAASAQGNLKIGVINVGKLLENAPQSKIVSDKLQKEFEPRQQSIVAKRQKLQSAQESFQKDQAVMGEEERLNLQRQISDTQRELQRDENTYL